MTLFLSTVTLLLAMVGGLLIASLDMSRRRALRIIGVSFGEIVRNTPILVQLLWVYYVLPIVFGVGIDAITALIIGLSVYQAAFISEVYRAGIQAVPRGHREVAQVLGRTTAQSFSLIVLPQAIRLTLPPLASNFVQLITYSSLGAVISVSEITRRGMELSSSTFRPLEISSLPSSASASVGRWRWPSASGSAVLPGNSRSAGRAPSCHAFGDRVVVTLCWPCPSVRRRFEARPPTRRSLASSSCSPPQPQ
jgi:His/Glu/Gln/Arg/opine family amino acid ABC transporter permease subunit